MKHINKIISLVLAGLFSFSLVACKEQGSGGTGDVMGGTTVGGVDLGNGDMPTEEVVPFTNIKLAEGGQTDYKIVIPADADACVNYAATELQNYFKESTSADISIVEDTGLSLSSNAKYISLGDTTLKDVAGITVTREEVNQDGFKMIRKDSNMFIAAYESRGVLYGAYEFLHKAFGYECYAADEYDIRQETTAYLPDVSYTDVPSFQGRYYDGSIESQISLQPKFRLKVNTGDKDGIYGGSGYSEWIGGYHCESMHAILGPQEAKNPDWFGGGSVDANGNYNGGQWCFTNAELQDAIVAKVIQYLEADPDFHIVNLSEEDMASYCTCNRKGASFCGMGCLESTQKYTMAGTQIRFLNPIIDKIEAWVAENQPGRELQYCTFAYHSTLEPPIQVNENGEYEVIDESCIPHEKLYIRYTPIERCFYHAFNDESCLMNSRYCDAWNGWKAVTDRLFVWDYNINFSAYLEFFDRFGVLQREYQEYHNAGVSNILIQYTTGSNMASMGDLMNYIMAKLMWNVNLNVNVLIENFMIHYYKDAAPYMKEYLNHMRTHTATMDAELKNNGAASEQFHMAMYAGKSVYSNAEVWPIRVLEKALSLLDQAAENAKGDSKVTKRILEESICVRYMVLNNYPQYYSVASNKYPTMIDQWEADCLLLGVKMYAEGSGSISKLATTWRQNIR